MRRILVTLLLALAACGDGGTQPSSVVGSYTLQSIDGASLPVSIGSRGRVVGAMLTLTADGEFLMTMGTELNGVTETTMLWAGTYARTGTGVALTAILSPGTEGEVIVGSVAGGAITLQYDLDFGTVSPDDDERLLFAR